MSEINDTPAFPLLGEWSQIKDKGMSMRDYFAAKAMQALVSSPHLKPMIKDSDMCRAAYQIADSMLIVRAEDE